MALVNDSDVTDRDRQPVTALTVVMARHHRSVEPQARQACYGRDHPVNDSEVSERHRPPATALTVIMALHHRSVEPQTRQACYGRGQPVNDSDVIERYRQPTTALTVMMALHPHLINPNHHLPQATQKSQRRFWPRAPCHARLCDRLNLRASPLTSHCAGGRRGASSAFAEPLTVRSLASAATLSTAPSPACAADRQPGRCHARCPVTSTRGAIPGPTGGMLLPARDRDVVGWEPVGCSGGAPGTRPTRSTSAGLGMGVSSPVTSKQRLAP